MLPIRKFEFEKVKAESKTKSFVIDNLRLYPVFVS